jgi:integrase
MPRRRKEPFGLYQRDGSPIWQIDFTVKGRGRVRASSGTSNHARAKEVAQALYAKEVERSIKGDRATVTFAEAVMLYVNRGGSLLYTKPLVEYFKNRLISDIFPGDIRAAAKAIYPNASPATLNRQGIVPARAIINAAAESGYRQHIRVKSFKAEKPKRRAVDTEWMNAFLQHADARTGALALLMLTTAARIGQAVKIQWEDVDFKNATVIIPAAKDHEARVAHLTPNLIVALANLPRTPDRPVFFYRHHWNFYKHWRATCKAAGIDYVPPHQAGRHTFATMMLAAGVDPRTIAERGGWKSVRLMLETYAHNDAGAEAVQKAFDTFMARLKKEEEAEKPDDAKESKT